VGEHCFGVVQCGFGFLVLYRLADCAPTSSAPKPVPVLPNCSNCCAGQAHQKDSCMYCEPPEVLVAVLEYLLSILLLVLDYKASCKSSPTAQHLLPPCWPISFYPHSG